jgi:hypothetical protein
VGHRLGGGDGVTEGTGTTGGGALQHRAVEADPRGRAAVVGVDRVDCGPHDDLEQAVAI